jgi:hypothetical protein
MSEIEIVRVVVLLGKFRAWAVLFANVALLFLWWMIGPAARRAAEAELASGEMTVAAYTPEPEPR